MDDSDFEKIWHFTFGVQRLSVLVSAISRWMQSGGSANAGHAGPLAEWAAVADAYFDAQHTDEAFRRDYSRVLASIRKLEHDHAAFLADKLQGNIMPLLAETQQVLDAFSAIVESLGYPGAQTDAQSLRGEARKCLALQGDKST